MRKKAFVLLVFTVVPLLFMACTSKKEEKLDKIMKETQAEGKPAELVTSYDNSDQITYYRLIIYNGDKKEKSYGFNKQKKLGSYTTFEYDDQGNITKEYKYSPPDELLSTRYNKYDEQNRLAEFFDEDADIQEYTYTSVCEYDINNNLIKTVEYQEPWVDTNLYGYSEYEYEDNQLMAVKIYGYDFEEKKFLKWYYENVYDDEGRVIKICFYNDKDELTGYNLIEYKES